MAKHRVQVPGLRPEPLQPQATPVDSYAPDAGAPPPANNELLQVSEALSNLRPGLQSMLHQRGARMIQEEAARTTQALLQEQSFNPADFAEKVRNKEISFGENPWSRRLARQQFFRIQANRIGTQMAAGAAEAGVMSMDREGAAEWAQGFYLRQAELLGLDQHEDAEEFANSFFPSMQEKIEGFLSFHEQEQARRTEAAIQDQTTQEFGQVVSDFDPNSSLQSQGIHLGAVLKSYINQGLDPRQANMLATRILVSQAYQQAFQGDPQGALEMLQVRHEIPTGPGGSLGGIKRPEIADQFANAERFLENQIEQQADIRSAAQQQRVKTNDNALLAEANGSVLDAIRNGTDPVAAVADLLSRGRVMAELGEASADAVTALSAVPKTLLGNLNRGVVEARTNPDRFIDLHDRATQGHLSFAELLAEAQEVPMDDADYRMLSEAIKDHGRVQESGFESIRKEAVGSLTRVLVRNDQYGNPFENTLRISQEARTAFNQRFAAWVEANPSASRQEALQHADELVNTFLDSSRYNPKDEQGEPEKKPLIEPEKATASLALDAVLPAVFPTPEVAAQALADLSRGRPNAIVDLAQRLRLSPEEVQRQLFGTFQAGKLTQMAEEILRPTAESVTLEHLQDAAAETQKELNKGDLADLNAVTTQLRRVSDALQARGEEVPPLIPQGLEMLANNGFVTPGTSLHRLLREHELVGPESSMVDAAASRRELERASTGSSSELPPQMIFKRAVKVTDPSRALRLILEKSHLLSSE